MVNAVPAAALSLAFVREDAGYVRGGREEPLWVGFNLMATST